MDVNDNILRDALLDAAADEFSDILDNDAPEIIFSARYLSRRKRFLKDPLGLAAPRGAKFKRTLVRAAVFALVFLVLFTSSVFSMEASAQKQHSMTKFYKDHLSYSHSSDTPPTADAGDWYASYLPEGYAETKRDHTGDFCSTHYVNGTKLIDFIYFHTSAYMNIKINTGIFHIEPIEVNGEAAIFHKAEKEGLSNVLMWFSDDGDLVFMLDAALPAEELVKIAESVKVK